MTDPSDIAPSGSPDPALRAAIQWHIDLDENPDDAAMRAAFERWLATDPSHADAWSRAGHTFDLLGSAKSVAFLPQPSGRKTTPARRWRMAAFAAAAAVLVAVAAPQAVLRWQADYATGAGQQRLVSLEDGSTVRLAPGSALKVDYAGARREVRLLSGEAYFEVARDAARPFVVGAKEATVTVLGTGFNIRLGEEAADVAVKHGRVRVDHGKDAAPSILGDGQWMRVAWNGASSGGDTAPDIVGGWSADRIVAVDQPLSEVIADMRRYHDGAIVLTDGRLGARIVTGAYDIHDPAKAMSLIVAPLGGKVIRITPWLLIVSSS